MDLTLQWYFSVGILSFCAVALAMRLGALVRRRTDRHAASGKLVRWLAARFSKRAGNWYCFFHIPDLTGEDRPAPPRPGRRQRQAASRPRLRAAAPPRG
ncbi:MAG: hypothetical protein V2L15_08245 [Desulfobacteraceae bacterium]|jgi:hypothetical protein|nr:hypothetical protein [Desulfobacteraceae bacterium]